MVYLCGLYDFDFIPPIVKRQIVYYLYFNVQRNYGIIFISRYIFPLVQISIEVILYTCRHATLTRCLPSQMRRSVPIRILKYEKLGEQN